MTNKLRILNVDYEITEAEHVVINNVLHYGSCDSNDCTITIQGGLNGQRYREVLLHELIHAVSNEYDAGLSEKQVDTIAYGLLKLFDENNLVISF